MLKQIMTKPGEIVFEEVPMPEVSEDQVLIKIINIGICGSDIHVYHGEHPFTSYPVTQGHEVSGEIVELGKNVTGFKVGQKVTIEPQVYCGNCHPCRHGKYNLCEELKVMGFQTTGTASEYFAVDASKVTPIPQEMSFEEGAMIEPLAVAVHAVKQVGDVTGMDIAVLGAGPIGNLVAQTAKGMGAAKVMITDISDLRLEKAKECGVDVCVNTRHKDFGEAMVEAFGPDKADVIYDCAGNNITMGQAIKYARKGSIIVLVAVFAGMAQVDLAVANDHELDIKSTMMYRHDDYLDGIRLVDEGKVHLNPLISKTFAFKDYLKAYQYIDENRETTMKVIINVQDKQRCKSVDFKNMVSGDSCLCGRVHKVSIDKIIIEKGAINRLPECVSDYGKKPFVLADRNTYQAAGEAVCRILEQSGITYTKYIFEDARLEPDEKAVGSAIMHYSSTCDLVICVGSGVLNDIGKILSNVSHTPYIIVATAPSMDGYASATSSMSMDGLKISLPSKCANVIIGDLNILSRAPEKMLRAGLGDMVAKYVSICEWRIAHEVTGEYYCENVAKLVRKALKKCVDHAQNLLKRDEDAVAAVFEGLVIGGIAMAYAGVSRPASGVEHYFSHVWDMRGLEFGTDVELHGIQCAVGTYLAVKLYGQMKKMLPDREKALTHAASFDYGEWSRTLQEFLGKGAKAMIALEAKEHKYSVEEHAKRIEVILKKWDKILEIMEEELPSEAEMDRLFDLTGVPKRPEEINIDSAIIPTTFAATKDIRDKYVLSRLAWDLGVLEELKCL